MAHGLESETMDLLASTVEDEKKTVTYRWLSRSMGYSVNVAKQFMETYLTTAGHNKVHATYYLSRLDPSTGNRTILLVNQEDLKAATKDNTVVSHHIYSLEPSPLKDRSLLSVSNAEATQMQKGKDINMYRIVQNRDVTVSKSANRGIAASSAAPKPNSAVSAKPTAPAAKPTAPVVSPLPSSTASAPVTYTPASTPSATTASKSKEPAKNSMMSFFGKAGATKPTPSSATNTSKPSSAASKSSNTTNGNNSSMAQKRKADTMSSNNQPRSTPQVSDDDDEEVDSEEERDRRLALSSRLDQDQGPVTETATSKPMDLTAVKKRQRSAKLLAVDDDDEEEDRKQNEVDEDEDVKVLSKEARLALEKEKDAQRLALENMMLMDDHHAVDEDEDSVMIDVEAVDSAPASVAPVLAPSSVVTSSVSNGNGTITRRVRGHRAVTKKKTSVNERGYMVTESIVVMEPFSEDEIIEEAPAPVPAATPAPAARAEPASAKGATSGPKKKAGSGNQSLLNFFSKK